MEALAVVAGERRILDDRDRRVLLAEHPPRQGWIGRRRRPLAKAKTRDRRRRAPAIATCWQVSAVQMRMSRAICGLCRQGDKVAISALDEHT